MTVPYNLGDAIDRERNREDLAVIDLGGDLPRTFTFRQLDDMSNAFARLLLARGLSPGDRVAIVSANRVEYIAAFLGTLRAGLVSVPVNIKLPAKGVEYIIRDSDARFVLCDSKGKDMCPRDIPHGVFGEKGWDDFGSPLSSEPFTAVIPAPRQAAMFLYTSGSTGEPKEPCCRTKVTFGCLPCAAGR